MSSDDPTEKLPLAWQEWSERLKQIEDRLAALEEKVQKRGYDTRPIYEAHEEKINKLQEEIEAIKNLTSRRAPSKPLQDTEEVESSVIPLTIKGQAGLLEATESSARILRVISLIINKTRGTSGILDNKMRAFEKETASRNAGSTEKASSIVAAMVKQVSQDAGFISKMILRPKTDSVILAEFINGYSSRQAAASQGEASHMRDIYDYCSKISAEINRGNPIIARYYDLVSGLSILSADFSIASKTLSPVLNETISVFKQIEAISIECMQLIDEKLKDFPPQATVDSTQLTSAPIEKRDRLNPPFRIETADRIASAPSLQDRLSSPPPALRDIKRIPSEKPKEDK